MVGKRKMKRKGRSSLKRKTFKRRVTKPVKAYVRRAVQSQEEKKFAGFNAAASPVIATPIFYLNNGLARGVERFARTGNIVRMKKLEAYLNLFTSNIAIPQNIRVMLIMDRSALGVAPTAAQLFVTPAYSFNSPLEPTNVPSRFRILYDRKFALNIGGGSTNIPMVKQIRIRKSWKAGQKVIYNDGALADITSIQKYSLYWVFCNANAAAANIDLTSELYFTDS